MRCRVRTTFTKINSLCATHPTNPNSHHCATLTLRTLLTALTSLPGKNVSQCVRRWDINLLCDILLLGFNFIVVCKYVKNYFDTIYILPLFNTIYHFHPLFNTRILILI